MLSNDDARSYVVGRNRLRLCGRKKEFIGSEMRNNLQALTTTTPHARRTAQRTRLKSMITADILRDPWWLKLAPATGLEGAGVNEKC